MNTYARAFAIALMALTLAAVACGQPRPEPEPAAVPAPDFSVKDLKGNTLSLADFRGKVLVINFWATWCPPCRREIPDFIAAYKELKGQGLEILGVSVDQAAAPALLDWTTKMGVNYPVALATPEMIAAYEPGDFIPATIIVDRRGLIRFRQSELMTKDTLVRLFNQYK